jgi:hypothetical protein
MEELFLKSYVSRLTKEDIIEYLKKEDIKVTENEINIIYEYIKKYFMIFYKGDPTYLFDELRNKLNEETYNKALELYQKYKKS